METYYLMLENEPVLYINLSDNETKIINKRLLPYSIREKLAEPKTADYKAYYKAMTDNMTVIKDYASSRLISQDRDSFKSIYNAFGLSQSTSISNRFDICLACKGISMTDSYWFRRADSSDTWSDIKNSLAYITDIALMGDLPVSAAAPPCPELTTKGLFRKAWIMENNVPYLLKSDRAKDHINTQMEILSSKILDCTDIPHVRYEKTDHKGLAVSKCPNFVNNGTSFVEAQEVISYCRDTDIDFVDFALTRFGKNFANIAVIDYILQNPDRHAQNYGFIMDNGTGELCAVAPLFDHNQALITDIDDKPSKMLPWEEKSVEEMMERFLPYADIRFDRRKWQKLKWSEIKYSRPLKQVETRILSLPCIRYD